MARASPWELTGRDGHRLARPAFLDNTSTATLELGRRSFRAYPLKYSDYAVARGDDLAAGARLAERQQAFVAKTEDFIRKNIAGQKTKQAQSRRKMLEKLERVERPEDVWAVAEKVAFRFAPAPRTATSCWMPRASVRSRGGRALFKTSISLSDAASVSGSLAQTARARRRF